MVHQLIRSSVIEYWPESLGESKNWFGIYRKHVHSQLWRETWSTLAVVWFNVNADVIKESLNKTTLLRQITLYKMNHFAAVSVAEDYQILV